LLVWKKEKKKRNSKKRLGLEVTFVDFVRLDKKKEKKKKGSVLRPRRRPRRRRGREEGDGTSLNSVNIGGNKKKKARVAYPVDAR